MGYRRVSYLEQSWYIIKQGIKDLFHRDREAPYVPVYTKLPDGTIRVTHQLRERREKQ